MKISQLLLVALVVSCSVTKNTQSMHPYKGDEVACGNFIAYKLTQGNDEYISISFNASTVEYVESQIYAIGKTDIVEVSRKKFNGDISAALCNDVMMDQPSEVSSETATSGTIEVIVSEAERRKAESKQGYRVTIVLKEVKFSEVTVDYLRLENIYVGWLPG